MKYTITYDGAFATVDPEPPNDAMAHLRSELAWVDVDDFSNVVEFYEVDENDRWWFASGAATFVRDVLRDMGHECTIDASVGLSPPDHPEWKFTGAFRPLQEAIVDKLAAQRYGFAIAPMGSGKTVMMTALLARLGQSAFIITQEYKPTKSAFDSLLRFSNMKPGKWQNTSRFAGDVTVASMPTIQSTLERQALGKPLKKTEFAMLEALRNAKVVIIDEAHNVATNRYQVLFEELRSVERIYGFTGTPFRHDTRGKFLVCKIGPILAEITAEEAIDNGLICPLTLIIEPTIEFDYGYTKKKDSVLPEKRVDEFTRRRQFKHVIDTFVIRGKAFNDQICEFVADMVERDISCAVIIGRIEQFEAIRRRLPDAVLISSSTPSKDDLFGKLERKEIMVVVTTLMNEATDVPSLGCVVLADFTRSEVRNLQRLRSSRTFSGETARGYYNKRRGYVYLPACRTDFLKTLCNDQAKVLIGYMRKHDRNKVVDLR